MKRSSVGPTLAIAAGGVVLVLCAVVLLLQWPGDPAPRDGVAPLPTPRPRAAAPDAGLRPLPAAPGDAERPAAPERVPVERPRTGPEAIVGRVVDAATDEVVPDFQVHVLPAAPEDPMARLDEAQPEPFHHRSGVFRLAREPGRYDVVVLAPGFEPSVVRDWEVPAADTRAVRVPLSRGPGLTGTVYGMYSGAALPDVEVFLHVVGLDDPEALPPQRRRAVTQHDGRFSFSPLPPGRYGVSLLEPDNRVDHLTELRVGQGTTLVDVYLRPRHTLSIFVHELDGRPAVDARVELRGSGTVRSGSTNAQGGLLFQHLPDGTYTAIVRHEGFEPLHTELALEGGLGQHVRHLHLEAFAR